MSSPAESPPAGALQIVNLSGILAYLDKALAFPPFWVEIDGYNERWAPDDTTIVRWFRGPWNTSAAFKDYMVGTAATGTQNPATGFAFLQRTIPHQHPFYPWLFCTECEFPRGEGVPINDPNSIAFAPDPNNPGVPIGFFIWPMITYIDASSGTDQYSCVARCTYRALDYEIVSDKEGTANGLTEINRWVSRYPVSAIEALPIPGTGLFFSAGPFVGQNIPENGKLRLMPTRELTYIWHQVPDVPWDQIDACVGCVNSKPFDPQVTLNGVNVGGYRKTGYAAGTLLMLQPDTPRHRSAQGRATFEISYKFLYRPQGHNNFPANDGNFYPATLGNNGQQLYPSADFSNLFTLPYPPVNYSGPGGGGVPPG